MFLYILRVAVWRQGLCGEPGSIDRRPAGEPGSINRCPAEEFRQH